MKALWFKLAAAALAAGIALPAASEDAAPGAVEPLPLSAALDPAWAAAPLWDDGNAEVAAYEGECQLEGAARPHRLTLVTEKEDLNREYWTKVEWPPGEKPMVPAMRQTQAAAISTSDYDVHFFSSVWVRRDDPARPVKLIVSLQEWRGTVFKEFQLYETPPRMVYSSFRDGEGSGLLTLRNFGIETHFEEELPLLARTLRMEDGLEAEFELEPTQSTAHAALPEPSPARLAITRNLEWSASEEGSLSGRVTWLVTVEARDGRRAEFEVADDAARTLLRFEFNDGRHYELTGSTRRQYWRAGG
ncbi:hypothetical protein HZA57_04425 [Candidatus Poribacteria bacterium]|nr:hypothetical protein [Candidatus Poribacteria bacterium]